MFLRRFVVFRREFVVFRLGLVMFRRAFIAAPAGLALCYVRFARCGREFIDSAGRVVVSGAGFVVRVRELIDPQNGLLASRAPLMTNAAQLAHTHMSRELNFLCKPSVSMSVQHAYILRRAVCARESGGPGQCTDLS
jgi:hypothetical protein